MRVTTLEASLLEVVGDVPDEKVAQRRPQWTPFGRALGKDLERGETGVIETAPVDVVWLTGRWVLKSPVRSCVFAGTVSFVLSFAFSWFLFVTIMGQVQVTPKTLLLNHFPEIRAKARNHGVEVKKGKFDTFCSAEWPTFNVGWPPQGTFSLDIIKKVRDIINRRHPDQYPYILMWQALVESPPSWLKPFIPLAHHLSIYLSGPNYLACAYSNLGPLHIKQAY